MSPRGVAHRVSLRLRLVAILVGAIVLSTLVFGALMLVTVRSVLYERTDAQLGAASSVAQLTLNSVVSAQAPSNIPSDYVVIIDLQGRKNWWQSSVMTPVGQPDVDAVGLSDVHANGVPYTVGSDGEGPDWRVVSYVLNGAVGSVSVALPLDAGQTALRLAGRTVLVGLSVAAIVALVGAWAVQRSLRPLRDVEATAAAISAGDYSRRMPEGQQDTEVGRLTGALNGMLSQVESAIQVREDARDRMRQFVADASHELRTPLAAIRGYAELHRQGAVPPEEVPRTFSRVEDEARRLGTLVEDLLALARLDEQRPLRRDPVDLAVLALDTAASMRALDPSRPVRVLGPSGAPVTPTQIVGDEDRLRQVLANLAGNAVAHTPPGTPVEIVVWPVAEGWAAIDVADHGPGVPDEAKSRVFQRFVRLDASRARGKGGGAGLGLAIVSSVVHAHSGLVDLLDTRGGGATLRVRLPAAGPGAPGQASGTAAATGTAPAPALQTSS